jgi:hypothetical protein
MSNILGKSTKTKSQSDTTASGTTRAYAPDWITQPAQDLTAKVTALGNADPLSYFADADPLQRQAGAGAQNLSGTPWNYEGALDLTRGVAATNSPQTGFVKSAPLISDFMNPYTKDVIDSSLADFDFNAGRTQAQQDLDIQRDAGFGGSGTALTKGETAGQLARARSSLDSGLRLGGWDTALQAAQSEAARKQAANDTNAALMAGQMDRQLGAAGQIADLAGAFGAEQRANIGTQAGIGDILRQIAEQKAQAPLDLTAWQGQNLPDILSQFFGADTTGKTSTTGTGKTTSFDPVATAGKIAKIAAMVSDRRLKCDIERLYTRPDGLDVYLYRYLWSPLRFIGVMAQEVLAVKPRAVVAHPAGFLMVDYSQLGD